MGIRNLEFFDLEFGISLFGIWDFSIWNLGFFDLEFGICLFGI
jgi:hypothetical protein